MPIKLTTRGLAGVLLSGMIAGAAVSAAQAQARRPEASLAQLRAMVERERDAREVANLMGRRAHVQALGRNDLWIDLFAKRQPDVSWYANGRYTVGLEAIKKQFGVGDTARAERSLDAMVKVYPDIDNSSANFGVGEFRQHALLTPIIEVAEDGQTAKGFWNSTGPQLAFRDGQPVGSIGFEKYAVDFIKEDGQWRLWHLSTYTEVYLELGKTLADQVPPPGSPRPAPRPGPDGKVTPNPYPAWSPWRVPAQVPLPTPYRTFRETFSYGPPKSP